MFGTRWTALLTAVMVVMGLGLPAGALEPGAAQPQVVVAVADTGVNPYHEVYRRPQNTAHPCTWVAGFDDCGIPALDLSIGEYASYEEALAADREVWDSVEVGQWYWIPKTNIIGAVCDGSSTASQDAQGAANTCILDDRGHGTATTSSVLSEAPESLLLVSDGNAGGYGIATSPVVPDIQSHSWGTVAPLPIHATDPLVPGGSMCNDGAYDDETIYFLAAGNDVPWPTPADCYRINERVQVVGGAYPGEWDNFSWTVYDFASWMCRPTAEFQSTTAMSPEDCGTSFAAPTAAGAAAAALLEIRRHEGFTGRSTPDMVSTTIGRDAFVTALRNAASYEPQSKFDNPGPPFGGLPIPAPAPKYLFWGYGWLDSTVTPAIVSCALGGDCPAKSVEANEYNARRRQARAAAQTDLVPSAQDDAGSGRDAGVTRRTAVDVTPGLAYSGRLDAYATDGDALDTYAFPVTAGQTVSARAVAVYGCLSLIGPANRQLASACTAPDGTVALPPTTAGVSGEYLLTYDQMAPPQDYRFGIGLDAPPPSLS